MTKINVFRTCLAVTMILFLAGCAKTREVIPPTSTLESSLQSARVTTQMPWPTSGVIPTTVLTPGAMVTPLATTAAMQTQPQTGMDARMSMLVLMMVVGGMLMVFLGKHRQVKGQVHGQRK